MFSRMRPMNLPLIYRPVCCDEKKRKFQLAESHHEQSQELSAIPGATSKTNIQKEKNTCFC